jgi:predicted dehydrogenase
MDRGNLSRRGFLQRSLGALAATGLPLWYAREALADAEARKAGEKSPSANDRIVMGAIGIGSPQSRGMAIMHDARGQKGVEYVAVCDVDKRHAERAAREIGGDCKQYHDFRELLDRKDIDAVTIAVPDHWHALVAIDALRKGKHVYCEKPLTLTVAEGIALVKAAKETGRVFQVGSQQRSDRNFRFACEMVRNGRLGKVKTIETRIGDNPESPEIPSVEPPRELDWDFWLGPTTKVDYMELTQGKQTFTRCHYEFRWWYEYSGGKVTDWGAHHNDIAQWALGMDESGPVAVEGTGQAPPTDGHHYNCHRKFQITYTYANGATLFCSPGGRSNIHKGENGILFEGEGGRWIFVTRGQIATGDINLFEKPPENATRLYVSDNHMGNFIDHVRKGSTDTICPASVGFHSVVVCHIGNIAVRTGKKLKWDPANFRFDDEEANKWLSREMRAPWKLEA